MMDAILLPILLALLNNDQGPDTDDGERIAKENVKAIASFQLDDKNYEVINATVDLVLKDTQSSTQAARFILTIREGGAEVTRSGGIDVDATTTTGNQQPINIPNNIYAAAHIFFDPSQTDDQQQTIIIDTDAIRSHQTSAPRASLIIPQSTSSTSSPPLPTTTNNNNLTDIYQEYIAAINNRDMKNSLPTYCHPTVTHNDHPLPLDHYRRLMEDAQAAIPDIHFQVDRLVTHQETGRVAALLRFSGVPVGPFAGVRPGEGAEKKKKEEEEVVVRFAEVVFYWFTEGRIERVISLVDLEAYRRQMAG